MIASRYNIVSAIPGTRLHVVANLLSGSADIMGPEELQWLKRPGQHPPEEFIEKGYITRPEEERQRFQLAYVDFLEQRDQEELQLFFVPTYQCNFDCSYCYQAPYLSAPSGFSDSVTDAFLSFVSNHLGSRNKYITLFGGEPLLPGKHYSETLRRFIRQCSGKDIPLAVVTNGYHLTDYLDILSRCRIREIQLTLDGTREVHDSRRPFKGGKPSFHRIVEGIDLCLKLGMPVNLRMVVDKDNLNNLPALARFAIDKGWTANPLFKTQLGRNYELHHCHTPKSILFSRLSLYAELYALLDRHPEIMDFHRPAFSIAKFLKDNGTLPPPLFDACPACKGEWAFDYTGKVYGCTATVGKPGEELGTFHPTTRLKTAEIETWQKRDVSAIEACRQCALQLACGGGCGAVAKHNEGSVLAPDCRPVTELLGMGIATYFKNEL